MNSIRRLSLGIQAFEKLRSENCVYVDKTQYIRDLVEGGGAYFLSRPRRFGKSLFVTTLEAYFRGRKDLFRGLRIEKWEEEKGDAAWTEYPVIPFYLSSGRYTRVDGLEDVLGSILEDTAREYDLTGAYSLSGVTLPVRFRSLLKNLYLKTGKQSVVLVDEYDKPLLETMIVNKEQEEANRQLYKEFFSALKDCDRYVRFEFFTGVTKFSKVSIFSDLNHLTDISLERGFSGICGITEQELKDTFGPEIAAMAEEQGISEAGCLEKLAEMYDGYHFSWKGAGVYNPYSLLSAFREKDFGNYWFETGTPAFLIRKLRTSDFTAENLTDGVTCGRDALRNYREEDPNPIPLFYQTGYLTICGYDREFQIYSLKFPNEEVEYAFLSQLVPYVLGKKENEHPGLLRKMVYDLRNGDPGSFLTKVKALFASIPYTEGTAPAYEAMWRDQIFLVLKLLGMYAACEVHTAQGRCDCVVGTKDFVYVMEFKVDRSAQEALEQIDAKGYTVPYAADERRIIKIGVNFSSETRTIENWELRDEEKGR